MFDAMQARSSAPFRRHLFFIGGFDPRGPKTYHRLWSQAAPAQAKVAEAEIEISALEAVTEAHAQWRVTTLYKGATAHTQVTQLRWDDLVQKWWRRGEWSLMTSVPVWCARLVRAGLYGLTRKSARPMFMSLILPPLALGLILLLMVSLVIGASLIGPWFGLSALLAVFGLMPILWRVLDRRVGLSWLTQCLFYFGLSGSRRLPEQEERCADFARQIIAAVDQDEVDEVCVVGFSLGANQALRALGMALEMRPDLGMGRMKLSLLTVGQSCGPYSLLSGDVSLLLNRERVARARQICWADATSASDPASGCKISPLYGLEIEEERVLSRAPRFHKLLTPERFAAIRRNPLAFHFQYLQAVDVPGSYDWFSLTCGPAPLSAQEAWA